MVFIAPRIQFLCLTLMSGFPYPDNVALASELESIVRVNGGVPATIGIVNGVAKIGMSPEELIELASAASDKNTLKLSRRDLAYACGLVCSYSNLQ
jgi:pseudouridine-5'-phosphate glycosidase/pseudouridine kinase